MNFNLIILECRICHRGVIAPLDLQYQINFSAELYKEGFEYCPEHRHQPFAVNSGNIQRVVDIFRTVLRDQNKADIIQKGMTQEIRVCCVCGRGMLQQPAALNPATGEFYCDDHAPNPFTKLLEPENGGQAN